MPLPLLATKLYLPPLRSNRVLRSRLVERLNQGVQPGVGLVLVSAPAGFGKTTLASEWARGTGLPVAWLALDEGDNDPVRFWHYLIAALQTVEPALGKEMALALEAPQAPPVESLLALLVNDLIVFQKPLLLVLDDVHLIENRAIHTALNFLVDHIPPDIHLVVLTRSDPPLQLPRRRARAGLCEVRAADLRFTGGEAVQFFRQAMPLALTEDDVLALEQRTEGWVAGLQMAAVALLSQESEGHEFVLAFTGDDRYIADYLVEEVLDCQPAEVQRFLLQSAVLDRFCVSLCAAVVRPSPESTGDSQADIARILEYLDRANLFLVPLDNRREWFRYHHLFAQLLRQRVKQVLAPSEVQALYHRAVEWQLQAGNPVEAIEYALSSGDGDYAAKLIEANIQFMFLRGELATLYRWSEVLSLPLLGHYPRLCVGLAWAANATGHNAQQEHLLQLVEHWVGMNVVQFMEMDEAARRRLPPLTLGTLVELTVQRTRLALDRGDLQVISQKYQAILAYLVPERDTEPFIFNLPSVLRPPMVFMIAMTQVLLGQMENAVAGFMDAAESAQRLDNIHIVALALGQLGQLQISLGRLRDAETTFRRALAIAAQYEKGISAYFGISHVGLGNLAYERNDFETARRELEHGIQMGKLWNSSETQLPGLNGLIQLRLAEGDLPGAEKLLNDLAGLSKMAPALVSGLCDAWRAQLWLHHGSLAQAGGWAQAASASFSSPEAQLAVEPVSAVARVWLAQGKAGQAAELLAVQAGRFEQAGQCSAWLRLETLHALALEAAGRRPEALLGLKKVIHQAQAEEYIRTILDAGQPMAALLRAYLEQAPGDSTLDPMDHRVEQVGERDFCLRLLAAFQSEQPATPAMERSAGGLVEPLSPRELELLRLLATEASNAEIAEQSYITVNTLKKHITNIYAKLGTATRQLAVQRARELKLL